MQTIVIQFNLLKAKMDLSRDLKNLHIAGSRCSEAVLRNLVLPRSASLRAGHILRPDGYLVAAFTIVRAEGSKLTIKGSAGDTCPSRARH